MTGISLVDYNKPVFNSDLIRKAVNGLIAGTGYAIFKHILGVSIQLAEQQEVLGNKGITTTGLGVLFAPCLFKESTMDKGTTLEIEGRNEMGLAQLFTFLADHHMDGGEYDFFFSDIIPSQVSCQ